jgi:hypothetical protein
VLGLDGDDVLPPPLADPRLALEGQVVRLGGAGGEDDLLAGAADERRDLLARPIYCRLRLPAERVVAAGRIAEVLGKVRQHRLDHARIDPRGGVVVHEDGKLDGHQLESSLVW